MGGAMAYFPFFIELKHKKCYIIGGGAIAYRKAEAMLEYEADVTVISPMICEEILLLGNNLHIIPRTYNEKDIEDAFMVIAATDNPEVNSAISKVCTEMNILVNVVDEIEKCNFLFPAYVKRGNISIGVTTSGKSPVIAGYIKKSIQENLPDYYEALVDNLGGYRDYVKQKVHSVEERSAIFKRLAKLGIDNGGKVTQEDVEFLINETHNVIINQEQSDPDILN